MRFMRVTVAGEEHMTKRLLDLIADKVLSYRPKPKSEPAKVRQRKRRRLARKVRK